MTPLANKQLEDAIFFAALHIGDPEQRRSFLDHACLDEAMRQTVEAMLCAEEGSNALVARGYSAIAGSVPVLAASPPEESGLLVDERIGTWIGPYMLLESLGKGGYGEVYRAEQREPMKREVALKVIKLGMDTRSVIRRFDAERQTLALMDHPNIARVLDAGATVSGRPYFVLELVRGPRITDYVASHRSSLRQRLELFTKVCHAILHAHQKGIIHRDIKPSNVLITEQDGAPVPKVIDFGIAKAIEGRSGDETLDTASERLLGTPAYMSPEQAENSDVDTRSDVYSLGATLYELVTGRPPFSHGDFSRNEPEEIRRTIRLREPRRPSALLRELAPAELPWLEEGREPSPARIARLVRGDLDAIILCAMEKDRSRRYETVNGLLRDVERFLGEQPVFARPSGRLYSLKKLIRRNRGVFASVGLVVFALVIGMSASTVLYLKARRAELRQAELRKTTEWALAKEEKLRRRAETREQLTEAVALMRQGDYAQAADVLGRLQAAPDRPSLDAVTALREGGGWLGERKRWDDALRCFAALFEIDKLDPWRMVTLNCQAYGTLLAAKPDAARYRSFCESIVILHQDVTDGDEATRLLKSCLLQPLDPKLERQLRPLAEASLQWNARLAKELDPALNWAAMGPCLWHYRVGDAPSAIALAEVALAQTAPDTAQRATYDAILALAYSRIGQLSKARSHRREASSAVDKKLSEPVLEGSPGNGYWYDWLFAKVLVAEAGTLVRDGGDSQSGGR